MEVDRQTPIGHNKTGRISLKTSDMEASYELGNKLIDMVFKERIVSGDVIQINRTTGRITKLGRSINRQKDYDAVGAGVKFVHVPTGEVQKRSENVQTISLHDIDVINSRTHGYLAVFSGDTGEIKNEIRTQINKKVSSWIIVFIWCFRCRNGVKRRRRKLCPACFSSTKFTCSTWSAFRSSIVSLNPSCLRC